MDSNHLGEMQDESNINLLRPRLSHNSDLSQGKKDEIDSNQSGSSNN